MQITDLCGGVCQITDMTDAQLSEKIFVKNPKDLCVPKHKIHQV